MKLPKNEKKKNVYKILSLWYMDELHELDASLDVSKCIILKKSSHDASKIFIYFTQTIEMRGL